MCTGTLVNNARKCVLELRSTECDSVPKDGNMKSHANSVKSDFVHGLHPPPQLRREKSVSLDNDPPTPFDDAFLDVVGWDAGTTGGGSSGAAQLYGGTIPCH